MTSPELAVQPVCRHKRLPGRRRETLPRVGLSGRGHPPPTHHLGWSATVDARPATAVFGFHTFVAAPIAKSASSRWSTPGTLFIPPGPSGARLEELEDGQVARPIAAKQSHEYQHGPGGSYGSHRYVRQAEEGQPDNASSDQHNCGGYP